MKRNILCISILSLLFNISPVYAGRVGYVSTRPATAVEDTPETNLFSINGSSSKFILLDCDEEGFFCTTKEFYGTQPFDPDGTGKFDIEDENNIAYWLNNVFPEKGGEIWNDSKRDDKFPFPEIVQEYIIEHDWLCEAGYESSDYPEDYTVRAKFALMSVTEWKKYNEKIGYADNLDTALYYWLRSVNGTIEPGTAAPVMVVSPGGTAQFGKVRNGYGVRPVFYLKRDFFKDVKMDVTLLGDNVKKSLRDNFTDDELKKVYNAEEIAVIRKELPPQAKAVSISGISQTGSVLKGTYTYFSPEGEPEGESEYRWLRSKTNDGPYSVITGENKKEFKVRDIDEGYYFAFEVVPKSKNSIGHASRSKATNKPAVKDAVSTAEDVGIDGNAVIGERLIARYNYRDENGDMEDGTLIRWQSSDDGVNFSDIQGAIGLNYVVPRELEGKYIRFTINVKSVVSDVYGETVISDVIGPVVKKSHNEKVISILDNGTARILSDVSESNDIPFWTVYSADGTVISVVSGGTEYQLKGNEASVKAGVFRTGGGTLGRIYYSDTLVVKEKREVPSKNIATVNQTGSLFVKGSGDDYANSVEIRLECDGVSVTGAESEFYDVYISGENNNVIYLTGKDDAQINVPENIVKINVSGSGTVKIVSVKGVYEHGSKIISNEPDIYFE